MNRIISLSTRTLQPGQYERYSTSCGNPLHALNIDILLSTEHRSALTELVVTASRLPGHQESSLELRATALVEGEGDTVWVVNRLRAVCDGGGATWFEFDLNGEHVCTEKHAAFEFRSNEDLPSAAKPDSVWG